MVENGKESDVLEPDILKDGQKNSIQEKRGSGKKAAVVLLIVLLLAILGVLVGLLLRQEQHADKVDSDGMDYEVNVITDDTDALQDAVDRMVEKAKEGQMALSMRTEAYSEDGRTFVCYLGNSEQNRYDMFMVLYRDDTQEELYRTGLIPIGSHMEEFTLEEALEPGRYEATIVYNQVEEDRETVHAQVNVGILLIVK